MHPANLAVDLPVSPPQKFMSSNIDPIQSELPLDARTNVICLVVVALIAVLVSAACYVWYFEFALLNDQWQEVKGFTRILIPDVFLYISLTDSMDELNIFQLAVAGVKNALGPVVLWNLAGRNWYGMLLVNMLFIVGSVVYTMKLARFYVVDIANTAKVALTLILLPVMIYYCIGPAKELPTLFALTGFFYHFIKRDLIRWLLMAMAMVLFRYQLLAVLLPFIFLARFTKNPLRRAVQLMMIAAMAYPLIAQVGIISPEETAKFRDGAEGQSGALIESIRDSVPIVSALATGIRIAQSVLEPAVNVFKSDGLYEGKSISVINIIYLLSLVPLLPYWYRAFFWIVELYKVKRPLSRNVMSLYAFLVLFVVPVGGFSFVHHRYLFPITALVLLAGYESVRQARRREQYENESGDGEPLTLITGLPIAEHISVPTK